MPDNYLMVKMNKASLYNCKQHQENSRIKINRRILFYFSLLTDKYVEKERERTKKNKQKDDLYQENRTREKKDSSTIISG